MLSLKRSIPFVVIFLFVLLILLAIVVRLVFGVPVAIKSSIGAVLYFFVMSGFILLHPLVYFWTARRFSLGGRRLAAIFVFAICYVGFFMLFSDSWLDWSNWSNWSTQESVLFVAGSICVYVSDMVATAIVPDTRLTAR